MYVCYSYRCVLHVVIKLYKHMEILIKLLNANYAMQ